jgi:23S rRNA (pseudouridine1915-N3)-methyltransferase
MKIAFWSIGKQHDASMKEAITAYTGRIQKYASVSWEIIPGPKHVGQLNEVEIKKREGRIILDKLDADTVLVALDENGKQLSSVQLANFLVKRSNMATKKLTFLIGGAFGLDQSVLDKADLVWSLSQLTFPHQLVRILLAEQVYRAYTIIKNEKYHHS